MTFRVCSSHIQVGDVAGAKQYWSRPDATFMLRIADPPPPMVKSLEATGCTRARIANVVLHLHNLCFTASLARKN